MCLDEQLANQIAAGEVVERPSSVVKELVENAVDAGSTTIDIDIEEGGLTLSVSPTTAPALTADDIETAFQRHATSKISSRASDLFRIASLGFRGEALPSIAAVSRMECVSLTERRGLGRSSSSKAARSGERGDGAPQGTEMTVRDLFYNTPARLKYMKTIQTELGHISDYV